ncbi:MAG: aminotransferase class I/II-fold pyridoxal phosphate-dependent enzyme [Armatimonadota bacterium]|nr:aminotransferase class I/II-fold pyridoxal phosphate-dependent enzyme [Armatimonadota bacterium]
MEQAQRLQRIPPYPFREVAALKTKMIEEGNEPIDFGIGDPDMPTPQFVIDALCEAAHDPETHPYDESGFGTEGYKRAIADFVSRRFGVEVSTDGEIQSTIGAKEALAHIVWAYIDPADVVLVPDPAYSVYRVQTSWCGGAPFPMPLMPENDFLPDLEAIPEGVRQQAKMMFLNYPNNPTGAVAPLEFYQQAVDFARRYDMVIVQDAAYCEVYYDEGDRPHSILEVEGARDVAIEMHSLSKTFNMTGWRVGWAMGGAEHVAALSAVKSNVDSGTFMALQRAASVALDSYEDFTPRMQAEYRRRRDALVAGLQSLGCPIEAPRAAFYLWLPVPEGETGEAFASRLLADCRVLAIPGGVYGPVGEGFVRMSLTIKAQDKLGQIEQAIENMRRGGIRW